MLYDAAMRYFKENGVKTIPTVKRIQDEIEDLTSQKNAGYTEYRESQKREKEGKFSYVFTDAPPDKAYSWSLAIIRNILKDETYIGNTIHNKQSTVSYKNKKIVQRPEEEWVRIENTHEPIISRCDNANLCRSAQVCRLRMVDDFWSER